MRKSSVIVATCLTLVSSAAVASPVGSLLNNVGLYGEYASVTSQDGFYGDADVSYTPDSFSNTASGNSADVNIFKVTA